MNKFRETLTDWRARLVVFWRGLAPGIRLGFAAYGGFLVLLLLLVAARQLRKAEPVTEEVAATPVSAPTMVSTAVRSSQLPVGWLRPSAMSSGMNGPAMISATRAVMMPPGSPYARAARTVGTYRIWTYASFVPPVNTFVIVHGAWGGGWE